MCVCVYYNPSDSYVGWPSIVGINSNDVNERITLDYVYKPVQ